MAVVASTCFGSASIAAARSAGTAMAAPYTAPPAAMRGRSAIATNSTESTPPHGATSQGQADTSRRCPLAHPRASTHGEGFEMCLGRYGVGHDGNPLNPRAVFQGCRNLGAAGEQQAHAGEGENRGTPCRYPSGQSEQPIVDDDHEGGSQQAQLNIFNAAPIRKLRQAPSGLLRIAGFPGRRAHPKGTSCGAHLFGT